MTRPYEAPAPGPDDAGAIYDTPDVVGARIGLPGGGLHAYFTGDMLHPPMVLDEAIWRHGIRWAEGSARHVVEVADLAEIRLGHHVLDIGCGLGGPARLLVDRLGASVTSVTRSRQHAASAAQLNRARPQWRRNIDVRLGDCAVDDLVGPYDAALSINMIYLVEQKLELVRNVYESLKPGGRFVIDDWMITPLINDRDRDQLNFHFGSRHFLAIDEVDRLVLESGFPPIEKVVDRGDVGRTLMRDHSERETREYFGPKIIADFPGSQQTRPTEGPWGAQMIDEWVAGVNLTIRLYMERKMTYRRALVRKPA